MRGDLSAAGFYKRPQQPEHLLQRVRSRLWQAGGSERPAQAARGRTVASSWIRCCCCCRDVARDTDSLPVLYTSSQHQDCWTTDLNMTTAAPQQLSNSSHKMLFTDYSSHSRVKQGLDLPRKIKPLSFRRWFFSTKGRRKGDGKESLTPPEENKPYLEEQYVNERLQAVGDADVDILVQLPHGLNCNEWLASHTVSFFEHINMMYGTLSELCTPSVCTSMAGPGNTIYQWVDEKGKKLRCGAPQYIEYAMSYTEKALTDEALFPTKYGNAFPTTFLQTVKKLHRLLFHVLAHIYHAHYTHILRLTLQAHLNMLFHHFMTFARTFDLLEDKESEVLEDLFQGLRKARIRQLMEADSDLPPPPPPLTTDTNNAVTPPGGDVLPPPCAVTANSTEPCAAPPQRTKDSENKENVNSQEEFPPPPPPIAS